MCRAENKIRRRCILRARQPRRSIILDRYVRQTSLEDYVALSARMYGRVRVYRRDRVVHKLSERRRRPSESRRADGGSESRLTELRIDFSHVVLERDYDTNVHRRERSRHVFLSFE